MIEIPAGYRPLTKGETIRLKDRFSDRGGADLNAWQNCRSSVNQRYQEQAGGFPEGRHTVIREVEAPASVEAVGIDTPKFAVGTDVKVTWGDLDIKGVITTTRVNNNPKLYRVAFTNVDIKGFQLASGTAEIAETFLSGIEPVISVDRYTVEMQPKGVQVGCTFVSDDQIREIARRRNVIPTPKPPTIFVGDYPVRKLANGIMVNAITIPDEKIKLICQRRKLI